MYDIEFLSILDLLARRHDGALDPALRQGLTESPPPDETGPAALLGDPRPGAVILRFPRRGRHG